MSFKSIADYYYNTNKPLVQDAFGSIYQAKHKITQKKLALQVIPRALTKGRASWIQLLKQEINVPKAVIRNQVSPYWRSRKQKIIFIFLLIYAKKILSKLFKRSFLVCEIIFFCIS